VSEESVEDKSDTKISEDSPIQVKITNPLKKEVQWNDSKDDIEYDELTLSDEDMDI